MKRSAWRKTTANIPLSFWCRMIQRIIHLLKDAAPKEMNHLSTWRNTAIPSHTAWIGFFIPFRPYYWPWNLGLPESFYSYHNLSTSNTLFCQKFMIDFLPSFKRFFSFFFFFQYFFHLFKNSVFVLTRLVRIMVFFLSNKVIFLKGGSNGFMWYLKLILVFLLKQCIIKLCNFLKMSFPPVVLMMCN